MSRLISKTYHFEQIVIIILSMLYIFFLTGCFAVMKEKSVDNTQSSSEPSDLFGLDKPSAVNRLTPISVRETRPRIYVGGVRSGDTVAIYSDSSCSTKIDEIIATGTSVTIQTSNDLPDGSYTIYSRRINGSDQSDCSTVSANVTVNTIMNIPTVTNFIKTTGVSIAIDAQGLVTGDLLRLYSTQSECQNSSSEILNFTISNANQKFHIHSLAPGTYQYWLKVTYSRSYAAILESTCVQSASLNLTGQNLTTTYITQWQTDFVSAGAKTIKFPGTSSQDIIINWGDGTSSQLTSLDDSDNNHNYSNAGTYLIEISGTINGLPLYSDNTKLRDVIQWGTYAWTDMAGMFRLTNFNSFTASDSPNLSNCTTISGMFANSSFNGNINHWNVSNISNMSSLFGGNSAYNQPLNSWNTANVTNMSGMFYAAGAFNQPIGNWDTSKVTNMSGLFLNAGAFNQDISTWNTSNVTDMSTMFSSASAFNQPIGNWNTGKVTNMNSMFKMAASFNQSINNWDVSSVTTMQSMFSRSNFNQNINSWNVSSVVNMNSMFSQTIFNQPLNNWNVANVTNMYAMFRLAYNFNQDISNWNTSKVIDMYMMFSYAAQFNQNLTSWTVNPNVVSCSDFNDNSALTNIPNFTQCNPN